LDTNRLVKVVVVPGETSPGTLVTRSVVSSLRSAGREVVIFEPRSSVRDEQNFIRELRSYTESSNPDVLLPVFFPEVLSRHKNEFPGLLIPTDDAEKIEILDSKIRSYELASSLGILVPSRLKNDTSEPFPVVFRRDKGQGGDSVYFPKDKMALGKLCSNSKPDSYLVTEFIPGKNVSIDVLRWKDFFFAGAYEVLLPQSKGISVCRRSIANERLVIAARTMLDAVDYQGVCGFDFRQDADGKIYFLECNPRFGAGLPSQLASGFDVPELLLRLAEGEPLNPAEISYKTNVLTRDKEAARFYLKKRAESKCLDWRDIWYSLLRPAKEA